MSKNIIIAVILAVAVVGTGTFIVIKNLDSSNNNQQVAVDETGYIYVEAGDGTLTGFDGYGFSYIQESARGLEAYLAEKDVAANYNVEVENSGTYKLEVSLSDDAMHDQGARDASVFVNGVDVLQYNNIPEDTKGWKWYSLGNISLYSDRVNTISFTKDDTTSAAFVMDQFRLIPVL